jgi:plastocyanin
VRVVFLTVLLMVASQAQYAPAQEEGEPAAEVDANGNAFVPGSLGFDPVKVRVPVGGVVRWTNTDQTVPHTSTEDHGLWRLSGSYGAPGPFQGYGPGESVERPFEAGTHHYYCEVHPEDMRAVVEVPVTLRKKPGRPRATAVWSESAPDEGLGFEVQRRRNGGPWRTLFATTTEQRKSFRLGPSGTRWRVRARLHDHHEPDKATDWSPVVSIRRR